ncbi:MAG: hypothetical protein V3U92_12945 [Cellulophaga sp.]
MNKILIGSCVILFSFTNCSKNEDNTKDNIECFGGTWIQEIAAELSVWTTSAQEYSTDPSKANCDSYKSAVTNYLNALDKIKKCVPTISLDDFNKSIEEAKVELTDIGC